MRNVTILAVALCLVALGPAVQADQMSEEMSPVEKMAPAIIWPSPPMLMTLARNAIVIPTPTSSSGVALSAVSISPSVEPKAPRTIAQ